MSAATHVSKRRVTAIVRDRLVDLDPASPEAIALGTVLATGRSLPATDAPAKRPRADRPVVENAEYIAFATRILAAMGKRAAVDIDSLTELAKLRDEVDAQLTRAGLASRDQSPRAQRGDRLGVTKQAVAQRLRRAEGADDVKASA